MTGIYDYYLTDCLRISWNKVRAYIYYYFAMIYKNTFEHIFGQVCSFCFENISYNAACFFIYCLKGNNTMDTKIALIGIIVESAEAATPLNNLLHEYGSYMVGRMGIPYSKKEVNIISVVIDAPENVISALSGKLGRISGISVKTMIAKTKNK